MTAADAARRGYRLSLDIKKSDCATLSVFIQRLHHPRLPLSPSRERVEPISQRVAIPFFAFPLVFCSCENNSEHLAISCHRLPGKSSFPLHIVARWAVAVTAEDGKEYNFDELGSSVG